MNISTEPHKHNKHVPICRLMDKSETCTQNPWKRGWIAFRYATDRVDCGLWQKNKIRAKPSEEVNILISCLTLSSRFAIGTFEEQFADGFLRSISGKFNQATHKWLTAEMILTLCRHKVSCVTEIFARDRGGEWPVEIFGKRL